MESSGQAPPRVQAVVGSKEPAGSTSLGPSQWPPIRGGKATECSASRGPVNKGGCAPPWQRQGHSGVLLTSTQSGAQRALTSSLSSESRFCCHGSPKMPTASSRIRPGHRPCQLRTPPLLLAHISLCRLLCMAVLQHEPQAGPEPHSSAPALSHRLPAPLATGGLGAISAQPQAPPSSSPAAKAS